MACIMGDRGSKRIDSEARTAVGVLGALLVYHCFMWLEELGGRVIVEWYARRR